MRKNARQGERDEAGMAGASPRGGSLGQVKLVDEMELGGWLGEGDGVLLIT